MEYYKDLDVHSSERLARRSRTIQHFESLSTLLTSNHEQSLEAQRSSLFQRLKNRKLNKQARRHQESRLAVSEPLTRQRPRTNGKARWIAKKS